MQQCCLQIITGHNDERTRTIGYCKNKSDAVFIHVKYNCLFDVCCADVDECAVHNGWCTEHSTCKNTPGSYDCVCDDGYKAHGSKCVGELTTLLCSCLVDDIFILILS